MPRGLKAGARSVVSIADVTDIAVIAPVVGLDAIARSALDVKAKTKIQYDNKRNLTENIFNR